MKVCQRQTAKPSTIESNLATAAGKGCRVGVSMLLICGSLNLIGCQSRVGVVKESEQTPAVSGSQASVIVDGATTTRQQLPMAFTPTDNLERASASSPKSEGKGIFSMGSLSSLFGKKDAPVEPSTPAEAEPVVPEKKMDREALNETFRQNVKNYVPVKPQRAKPGYLMVQPIYPPTMQVAENMRGAHMELSLAQITEQRQKIANGQHLYARAIKRRPNIFDVNQSVGKAGADDLVP